MRETAPHGQARAGGAIIPSGRTPVDQRHRALFRHPVSRLRGPDRAAFSERRHVPEDEINNHFNLTFRDIAVGREVARELQRSGSTWARLPLLPL
jgi:hypothetical protein